MEATAEAEAMVVSMEATAEAMLAETVPA